MPIPNKNLSQGENNFKLVLKDGSKWLKVTQRSLSHTIVKPPLSPFKLELIGS